jgi:hypothetical protein
MLFVYGLLTGAVATTTAEYIVGYNLIDDVKNVALSLLAKLKAAL